jgi:hypothetical protein
MDDLEISMFRRNFDSLLGTVLLAALLPMVILSAFRDALRLRRRGKAKRRAVAGDTPAPKPACGEFQFERAVEAYESLIDAVIAESRTCTLHK